MSSRDFLVLQKKWPILIYCEFWIRLMIWKAVKWELRSLKPVLFKTISIRHDYKHIEKPKISNNQKEWRNSLSLLLMLTGWRGISCICLLGVGWWVLRYEQVPYHTLCCSHGSSSNSHLVRLPAQWKHCTLSPGPKMI